LVYINLGSFFKTFQYHDARMLDADIIHAAMSGMSY